MSSDTKQTIFLKKPEKGKKILTSSRLSFNNADPLTCIISFHYQANGDVMLDEVKPIIKHCPYRTVRGTAQCENVGYHPVLGFIHGIGFLDKQGK